MSSSPPNSPESYVPPELLEATAAAWLSLRDRGMSAEETTAFMHWLQQDAQHATLFAELDSVWKDFDRLAVVTTSTAPQADLLAPRIRPRQSHLFRWVALGAAAAAVVLFTLVSLRSPAPTSETSVGAFQKLDLPDGSVAQLNTDSAIITEYTATERRIRVLRGEVFFNVAKNPARPFIVTVGPVVVRAVGTAFNVRQRDSGIEVLVTEGRVRVEDAQQTKSLLPASSTTAEPTLVAGERAIVATTESTDESDLQSIHAKVEKMPSPAVRRALAWQERRLEFDAVPLAEVVRDFNRYNSQQLVIDDENLANKRFSGIFRADGYEAFVQLLAADFGVTASYHEREIILRRRP